MKSLLFFLFFLSSGNCKETTPTTVYLCNSPSAKKYHYKSDCRGLSNCSYKIVKTTLEKANKDKKTLCGWEK
ncbi:hypothetical protein FA048_03870 [Pedobacter polaris]|uniref:Uncharacterized protein n=1 Tax=Pedobacter polaris TaxID=2571273 RepID=A0A4U1CVP6_9SPHI|nr:hypothetical protein FA048_03870 [Pedobacter polaris]